MIWWGWLSAELDLSFQALGVQIPSSPPLEMQLLTSFWLSDTISTDDKSGSRITLELESAASKEAAFSFIFKPLLIAEFSISRPSIIKTSRVSWFFALTPAIRDTNFIKFLKILPSVLAF